MTTKSAKEKAACADTHYGVGVDASVFEDADYENSEVYFHWEHYVGAHKKNSPELKDVVCRCGTPANVSAKGAKENHKKKEYIVFGIPIEKNTFGLHLHVARFLISLEIDVVGAEITPFRHFSIA
jgi:hypothetical protein